MIKDGDVRQSFSDIHVWFAGSQIGISACMGGLLVGMKTSTRCGGTSVGTECDLAGSGHCAVEGDCGSVKCSSTLISLVRGQNLLFII